MTDQKSDNLRVRPRDGNNIVQLFQLPLQLVVVANDSVVHDCDAPAMIEMWMRINVRLVSMGRPASMSDGDIVVVLRCTLHGHALDAVATESVRAGELSAYPDGFVLFILGNRDNSTGVISATFQYLQALDADGSRLGSVTKVANDATALVCLGLTRGLHLLIKV